MPGNVTKLLEDIASFLYPYNLPFSNSASNITEYSVAVSVKLKKWFLQCKRISHYKTLQQVPFLSGRKAGCHVHKRNQPTYWPLAS